MGYNVCRKDNPMDTIAEGKVDETVFPIIRGEAVSVWLPHIRLLIELLDEGKVEQVRELLDNLLHRQRM